MSFKVKKSTNSVGGIPESKNNRILGRNGARRVFSNPLDISINLLSELQQHGYSEPIAGNVSMIMLSENLIESLGFTMVENAELSEGLSNMADFSLIGSDNVDQGIDNKRIFDPDIMLLNPRKIEASDKFKSASDAFYNLDQERSESIKIISERFENKRKKPAIFIAKKLSGITSKSNNKMVDRRRKKNQRRITERNVSVLEKRGQ
jgi:hypothetical protein